MSDVVSSDIYRQELLALERNRTCARTGMCRPGCPVCRKAESLAEAEEENEE
jgi:hypothetical protein